MSAAAVMAVDSILSDGSDVEIKRLHGDLLIYDLTKGKIVFKQSGKGSAA